MIIFSFSFCFCTQDCRLNMIDVGTPTSGRKTSVSPPFQRLYFPIPFLTQRAVKNCQLSKELITDFYIYVSKVSEGRTKQKEMFSQVSKFRYFNCQQEQRILTWVLKNIYGTITEYSIEAINCYLINYTQTQCLVITHVQCQVQQIRFLRIH